MSATFAKRAGIYTLLLGVTLVLGYFFLAEQLGLTLECPVPQERGDISGRAGTSPPPPPPPAVCSPTGSSGQQQQQPQEEEEATSALPLDRGAGAALTTPEGVAAALRASLLRQVIELESKHTWEGVPPCVLEFMRDFTVSHLLAESSLLVPRPPATPRGWTGSDVGYGTNRVFVITYYKFLERQARLLDVLRPYKLEEAGMLVFWDERHLDVPAISNKTAELVRCFWSQRSDQQRLSKKEMSLILKQMTTYYYSLLFNLFPITVLEDDIVLSQPDTWPRAMKAPPQGWGLIMSGSCLNLRASVHSDGLSDKQKTGRCAHSYIISEAGAKAAFRAVSKQYARPIDWHHNTMCGEMGLDCYWMEPPAMMQVASEQHHEQDALHNWRNQNDRR